MTWVSILLVGLGLADLARSSTSARGRVVAHVVAPVTVIGTAAVAGVFGWPDVVALGLGLGGVAAWIELSGRAQSTGQRPLWALGALGTTLVGLVAFSGAASAPDGQLARWLVWADLPGDAAPSAARVLLLAGVVLFNVATANVVVRLVLLAIGALRPDQLGRANDPQPADRLKGGRLLGPMERLVIFGLGLAGELGAAGFVIAAKGLLRFPEIQASGRPGARALGTTGSTGTAGTTGSTGSTGTAGSTVTAGTPPRSGPAGIDDLTEYFLVGSFVSWLLALATLGLAR